MTRPLHDIKAIVGMLSERIGDLCAELLPAGKRDGAEWRCGSIAGEPGQSLGVHLHGTKAGAWCDFASGDPRHRGDALDLVAQVRSAATRWRRCAVASWLGLERARRPAASARCRPSAGGTRSARSATPRAMRQKAMPLFAGQQLHAGPRPGNTWPRGGCPSPQFPASRRGLRFVPECWAPNRHQPAPPWSPITRNGQPRATHRTLPDAGPRVWRKARLAAPKKVLGQFKGGFIPLWRGASARPIAEAEAGEVVAIAEGIEDALTVALHSPEWRALAAVSLSNMAAVQLPAACEDVVLIFDRDGENRQAREARERAVRALLEQGRSVRDARPPEGFKDFNDWHQREGAQGRGVA